MSRRRGDARHQDRKTCRHKTMRHNVYELKSQAQKVARDVMQQCGVYVEPYYCQVCGKYHVGKPR